MMQRDGMLGRSVAEEMEEAQGGGEERGVKEPGDEKEEDARGEERGMLGRGIKGEEAQEDDVRMEE